MFLHLTVSQGQNAHAALRSYVPRDRLNDERFQTGVRTRAPSGAGPDPIPASHWEKRTVGCAANGPPGPQDRWAPGGIKPGLRRLATPSPGSGCQPRERRRWQEPREDPPREIYRVLTFL